MGKEVETHEMGAFSRPRTRREIMKFVAVGLGGAAGTGLFSR